MTKTLILALTLLAAGIAHGQIYKWRDESGRWHYGDDPRPGATQVDLPPIQVYDSEKPAPLPDAPPPRMPPPEAPLNYSRAEVVSPAAEETIRNAPGEVGVVIGLEPSLRSGHRIRLLLDGAPASEAAAATAFTLVNVNRGAHTISAEILDAEGEVITTTEPRTFYVHRPSRLN